MRVTLSPIVTGALGTILKGLGKELEDLEISVQMEAIQPLSRRPDYWEESWRVEEILCHSKSREKSIANAGVKTLKRVNNSNNFAIVNKKKITCWIVGFTVLAVHSLRLKETKRELKRIYGSDDSTNCNWCTWNNSQRIGKVIEKQGNNKTSENHPDYGIIKIGQTIEKSPGDLRRLTVTQTQMRNDQLTLVRKIRKI